MIAIKIIEVKNLKKVYGNREVLKGIDFSVESGEIFGFLGPNGAGKSTTISMISTLNSPSEGIIKINGMDVSKYSKEVRKLIGLVPQDIALYQDLSAMDNLKFWGRMYGLTGKLLKERINQVLDIVGLHDRVNEDVKNYSGGMKRRINIGAALLHNPKILIMDEPTVGIDPQSRNHILDTVLKLNQDGMTVIYTSHYMEEVEYLCTRLAIIDHGQLIAIGSKEEIKEIGREAPDEMPDLEKVFLKLTGRELRD